MGVIIAALVIVVTRPQLSVLTFLVNGHRRLSVSIGQHSQRVNSVGSFAGNIPDHRHNETFPSISGTPLEKLARSNDLDSNSLRKQVFHRCILVAPLTDFQIPPSLLYRIRYLFLDRSSLDIGKENTRTRDQHPLAAENLAFITFRGLLAMAVGDIHPPSLSVRSIFSPSLSPRSNQRCTV